VYFPLLWSSYTGCSKPLLGHYIVIEAKQREHVSGSMGQVDFPSRQSASPIVVRVT